MTHNHHNVRFFRNTATGQCQAICTCGWKASGDRDAIQARAATHDMDMLDEPFPFKSGLQEDMR